MIGYVGSTGLATGPHLHYRGGGRRAGARSDAVRGRARGSVDSTCVAVSTTVRGLCRTRSWRALPVTDRPWAVSLSARVVPIRVGAGGPDALSRGTAAPPVRAPRCLGHASREHPGGVRRRLWRPAPTVWSSTSTPPPDGHVVVLHDAELDRTTDGAGPVREQHARARCGALTPARVHRLRRAGIRGAAGASGSRRSTSCSPRIPACRSTSRCKQDEPADRGAQCSQPSTATARASAIAARRPSTPRSWRASAPPRPTCSRAAPAAEAGRLRVPPARRGARAAGRRRRSRSRCRPRYQGIDDRHAPSRSRGRAACGPEVHASGRSTTPAEMERAARPRRRCHHDRRCGEWRCDVLRRRALR